MASLPAPKREQAISWKDFIRSHMEVLVATDFFTAQVLTLKSPPSEGSTEPDFQVNEKQDIVSPYPGASGHDEYLWMAVSFLNLAATLSNRFALSNYTLFV